MPEIDCKMLIPESIRYTAKPKPQPYLMHRLNSSELQLQDFEPQFFIFRL